MRWLVEVTFRKFINPRTANVRIPQPFEVTRFAMTYTSINENIKPVSLAYDKGRSHILLVDDDSDILVSVGGFIESAGLDVTRASSGTQALDVIATGVPVDAVVSDVMMPGMSGFEFLIEARRRRSKLPALFITGYADFAGSQILPSDVEVLLKPFRRREFMNRVQVLLGQR